MVWIDSLVSTLPGKASSTRYQDTSNALKPIGEWAEAQGVAVVAPWHLNKSTGSGGGSRMMDLRAFRSSSRSVLLVVPATDSAPGVTEGIVALDKANANTLHAPPQRYRLRSADYVVTENGQEVTASCAVADWIGEIDAYGPDIVRDALTSRPARGEREAVTWLRDYLETNGETDRQTILRDAETEQGYAERTVERAAQTLDVTRREESGHRTDIGRRRRNKMWSLPRLTDSTGRTDSTQSPDGTDGTDGTLRQGGSHGQETAFHRLNRLLDQRRPIPGSLPVKDIGASSTTSDVPDVEREPDHLRPIPPQAAAALRRYLEPGEHGMRGLLSEADFLEVEEGQLRAYLAELGLTVKQGSTEGFELEGASEEERRIATLLRQSVQVPDNWEHAIKPGPWR